LSFEDRQEAPADISGCDGASIIVDIFGSADYVDRRKKELRELGVRVRTFPDKSIVSKVKESEGVIVAFGKYLASYAPRGGTPKEKLLEIANDRIGIMNEIEQLVQLKFLTRVTGILHEAQVYQLKMWPLMLTHAMKSDVVFDYEGSIVIFNLLKTEGNPPENIESRFLELARYTKFLLGDEYSVVVKDNGKQIFRENGLDNEDKYRKLRDSI
jgi:hypothetical protein